MRRFTIGLYVIGLCVSLSALAAKSLTVDLAQSRVTAFDDGRVVKSFVINPGTQETPTRPGSYRISQKVRTGYRSNLVNMHNKPLKKGELGAPMDYWMRLGGTGMGFHRSSLWRPSGHWGSHGCLRMSRAGARWLFDWTPVGTAVEIRAGELSIASRPRGHVPGEARIASLHRPSAVRGSRVKTAAATGPNSSRHSASVTELPSRPVSARPVRPHPGTMPAAAETATGEPAVASVRAVREEAVQAPGDTRR